jgi:TonB family protein
MRRWIQLAGGLSVHAVFVIVFVLLVAATRAPERAAIAESTPLVWMERPGTGQGGGQGGNQAKASPAPLRREVSRDAPRYVLPRVPDVLGALELPGVSVAFAAPNATGPGTDTGSPGGLGEGSDGPGSGTRPGVGAGPGDGAFVDGTPGLTSPQLVFERRPEYTQEAMSARAQGAVLLEATVLENGSVGSVRIARSVDKIYGLDAKAIEAVRAWRFRPGTYQGRPVAVKVLVELIFTLR